MKIFCFIAFFALANVWALSAQTNTNAKISATTTNKLKTAPPARAPTQIFSDSWFYDNAARQMIYRGHVRVDDPQMKLTCAWLLADLPPSGERINHIVAETNVVIDFTDDKGQTNHATSDKAVYDFSVKNSTTNETVTLTGHAQMENSQGTLTGEPIIWNRANDTMTATNENMTFRQNLASAMTRTNSPTANTNKNTNKLSAPK